MTMKPWAVPPWVWPAIASLQEPGLEPAWRANVPIEECWLLPRLVPGWLVLPCRNSSGSQGSCRVEAMQFDADTPVTRAKSHISPVVQDGEQFRLLMRWEAERYLPHAVNEIRVATPWQFQYLDCRDTTAKFSELQANINQRAQRFAYQAAPIIRRESLAQLPTTSCGGRSVDFNLVNGMGADYGQFGYFEPSTAYLRHSSIDAVSQTR